MSPFCQDTEVDHSGGLGDEDMEDQCGVPERLGGLLVRRESMSWWCGRTISRLRSSRGVLRLCKSGFLGCVSHALYHVELRGQGNKAQLEINVPRNPLPPHTTSFFFAAEAIVSCCVVVLVDWWKKGDHGNF